MTVPENPYVASRAVEDGGRIPGPVDDGKPPVLAWAVVYAVNLVVPLLFAWAATARAGRVGMLFGLVVLFAAGCRACFVSRKNMKTLVLGGWFVAASQFVPGLQLIAGAIGIAAAAALGQATKGAPVEGLSGEPGGFVATLVTGGILLTVALGIGLGVRGLRSLLRGRPPTPGEFTNVEI